MGLKTIFIPCLIYCTWNFARLEKKFLFTEYNKTKSKGKSVTMIFEYTCDDWMTWTVRITRWCLRVRQSLVLRSAIVRLTTQLSFSPILSKPSYYNILILFFVFPFIYLFTFLRFFLNQHRHILDTEEITEGLILIIEADNAEIGSVTFIDWRYFIDNNKKKGL